MPKAKQVPITQAAPEPAFPIFVIKISRLLTMSRMLTHEQLREEGALHEWQHGDGKILFVSHTWLNFQHPDNEKNEKLGLLQGWLRRILDGSARDITPQWSQGQTAGGRGIEGLKGIKAKTIRRDLTDGYVWLDLASIPQADRASQGLAIQSIPSYIGVCSYFAVVVGPFRHDQLGTPRGINEWCSRGWCRLEQLANFLSETQKPLLVVKSPTFVESYTACGTIFTPCWRTSVGEGDFTVDDDRVRLGPVIRDMIDARRRLALAKGELFYYRILHSLSEKLVRGTGTTVPREETLEEWLAAMALSSATDKDQIMSAIHYAVVAGRVDIVAALLDAGADVHAKTTGNASHVITWLQLPIGVLALACMARNQPDMIRLLLARGADPFALSKGIGDVAMWACIGFQGLDSDPIETEYNIDVLHAHNPKTLDTVMPLVACDGPMMMAAFSIPALRHWQHAYPERFAADLGRIDGVGTSILGHHMVYVSDVAFIQTMLDMGFDLSHSNFEGAPKGFIKVMSRVMRFIFRRTTFPPNDVFQFAAVISPNGRPPYLHVAAAYAYIGALELLLRQGKLNVNEPNMMGMTPLHLAAYQGHDAIVETLLAAGADPLLKDERRRTASNWAKRRGHAALAATLRTAEAAQAPAHSSRSRAPATKYQVAPSPPER
jgi:hypothetical protein